MSTETITTCDVCKTKGTPSPGGSWASITIHAGWYGPHKWMTGPHHHPNDSAGKSADVCSADCALKWLRERITRIEENVKERAEWDAKEKERARQEAEARGPGYRG